MKIKKSKAYEYAKEDSIKIVSEFNIKQPMIAWVFRTSWLITLFCFYKLNHKRIK
jgi:hypothetical protein